MTLKSLSFSLLVVPLENAGLAELSEELHKKREMAPDFFKSAPIVIQILADDHSSFDFKQIQQIVRDENFILAGISGELSVDQKESLHSLNIAVLKSSRHAAKKEITVEKQLQTESFDEVIFEAPIAEHIDPKAQLYTGRVRSGQQVYAKENDLIITGDVNAGAEVIADGNIYIFGVLRGKALAGAMGDQKASVYCRSFSPELLSIAGVYQLTAGLPQEFINTSCVVSLNEKKLKVEKL